MNALKIIIGAAVTSGVLAVSSPALAQACCGGGQMQMDHGMMGHAGHGMLPTATPAKASAPHHLFMEPVQSVFDNYIRIQGALAQDSFQGVSATAGAMAKAICGDSMKMLSPKVAEYAEELAKAKDLESARAAFKPLSELLIQYVKAQELPPGTYFEAFCPMAKAGWLQMDKTIMNPYMGKAMLHCGQIKD